MYLGWSPRNYLYLLCSDRMWSGLSLLWWWDSHGRGSLRYHHSSARVGGTGWTSWPAAKAPPWLHCCDCTQGSWSAPAPGVAAWLIITPLATLYTYPFSFQHTLLQCSQQFQVLLFAREEWLRNVNYLQAEEFLYRKVWLLPSLAVKGHLILWRGTFCSYMKSSCSATAFFSTRSPFFLLLSQRLLIPVPALGQPSLNHPSGADPDPTSPLEQIPCQCFSVFIIPAQQVISTKAQTDQQVNSPFALSAFSRPVSLQLPLGFYFTCQEHGGMRNWWSRVPKQKSRLFPAQ